MMPLIYSAPVDINIYLHLIAFSSSLSSFHFFFFFFLSTNIMPNPYVYASFLLMLNVIYILFIHVLVIASAHSASIFLKTTSFYHSHQTSLLRHQVVKLAFLSWLFFFVYFAFLHPLFPTHCPLFPLISLRNSPQQRTHSPLNVPPPVPKSTTHPSIFHNKV
uniref:Uncharacterized protein TCIL3000_10_3310 n=1 Tax=Trypanosoma congolense (strain IL3000) TaxID=1068625 RepID=G0UW04_TRYCI|nr:unnamed protein product [Trypanosoma congolense IL3000]